MKYTFLFLTFLMCLFSCKEKKDPKNIIPVNAKKIDLKHAKGFEVFTLNNYKILEIKTPWPEAKQSYKYVLIDKKHAAKTTFLKDAYDGIIVTPIKKIVVTSTTHIPALELLNVETTLVGFPGTNYISSKSVRALINNGNIRDLGKNEVLNTEVLLELNPDVVVGFGIDGGNRSLETIKKSGIPVVFNGDWVESSPLAKAEWIKLFGHLYNKADKADSIFSHIEKNYTEAKKLARNTTQKPTVLSGAMHNDIWYLPNGTSTEAQLLKDANVNYLWSETEGSGSLKLNFESVFVKAKNADIWLNPSNYSSYATLKNANENHTMFNAFKHKNIYTISNTKGASGGVLYFELGMTRPDLALKDIIKICHPELLKNYTPYFFKPLP